MSSVSYHLQVEVQTPLGQHDQSTAYVGGSNLKKCTTEQMKKSKGNCCTVHSSANLYTEGT